MAKLEVYSRRWGHNDTYTLERTERGWGISFVAISGQCDPTGEPYLYDNLRQDSINYPAHLGEYLGRLWRKAEDENLSGDEVQRHLDQLAQWIQITEKSTPDGFF